MLLLPQIPRTPPQTASRRRKRRVAALALAALLPAACAMPPAPPANPFAGTWATADNHRIGFRDSTVVLDRPGGLTVMGKDTCGGTFRFGFGRETRDALTGLIPLQAKVRERLAKLLLKPDYPVAQMICGDGDQTYVLLDRDHLVAIYRTAGIAGIDRLSRR